jgi:hypothetical protein
MRVIRLPEFVPTRAPNVGEIIKRRQVEKRQYAMTACFSELTA